MDMLKRGKFIEIATKRVNNVKDSIRILSNCSNDNYEYSEEDVNEMFEALRESLNDSEKKFRERFKKETAFEFSCIDEIKEYMSTQKDIERSEEILDNETLNVNEEEL